MGKGLVSVVIPVYNQRQDILNCIHVLKKQTYPNYEIIVVDDGSTDGTREILKSLEGITLLCNENAGCARARSAGVKVAKGRYIACTDADCIADRKWLAELVKAIQKDKNRAGIVGNISNFNNTLVSQTLHLSEFGWWQDRCEKEIKVVVTANALLYKKDLFQVGFLDKVRYYGDDIELGQKIIAATGKNVMYCPKAKVFHMTSSRLTKFFGKMWRGGKAFYTTRSTCPELFFAKEVQTKWAIFLLLPFLPALSALRMFKISEYRKEIPVWRWPLVLLLAILGFSLFWISVVLCMTLWSDIKNKR